MRLPDFLTIGTANRPCLIRFSGAYHRCMGQWIGLLDAV